MPFAIKVLVNGQRDIRLDAVEEFVKDAIFEHSQVIGEDHPLRGLKEKDITVIFVARERPAPKQEAENENELQESGDQRAHMALQSG